MNAMQKFIEDISGDDIGFREAATGVYRGIFENSATDINVKQIAAQPGTCQQGIVQNDNLANDQKMPTDETVANLMKNSYAARFGKWCGTVGAGRTSLGMWGGTGPQNVNASTDSPST